MIIILGFWRHRPAEVHECPNPGLLAAVDGASGGFGTGVAMSARDMVLGWKDGMDGMDG